jgi:hypothetical protein
MYQGFKRLNAKVHSSLGVIVLLALSIAGIQGEALAAGESDPRYVPRVYRAPAQEEWKESSTDLPMVATKNDFSLYQTRSQTGFKFYVDVSSVSLGEDGVVRMILLAISPRGSVNITYEGFRCETNAYKIYASTWAFDKEWILSKRSNWQVSNSSTPNSYRSDLLNYYICAGIRNSSNEKGLKALLKKGKMVKHNGIKR